MPKVLNDEKPFGGKYSILNLKFAILNSNPLD